MIRKLSLLLSFIALLLTATFHFYASPVSAATASHIVISEVQIGGTTTTDEFVELYNPTSSNIDVTGWKLAKRTAAGTLASQEDLAVFPSSSVVNAHGYLLIAHTNYDGSPVEDITYTTTSSIATNNTVLLYDNAVTPNLIDKVGMDSAGDKETATANEPSTNHSIERKASSISTSDTLKVGGTEENIGNGEDTDNNSNDFVSRSTPLPQNSTAPTETPVVVSPTVSPTGSISPTATVTPTVSVTGSPTPSITGTISPTITGTPTPTVSPSVTATSTPSSTPTGTVTPTVSVTTTPSVSPTPTPSGSHVVISEIQTAGGTSTDEFVELYNPTNTNIDVTGWRLAVRTAGSTNFLPEETDLVSDFPSMTINAHGYLLIAHENYDGSTPENISYSFNSFTSNNTIVLYEPGDTQTKMAAPSAETVVVPEPALDIVDVVGLGNAQDNETATTTNPLTGQSKERKASATSDPTTLGTGGSEETAGNGEDTDNNSVDFVTRLVSQPQDIDSLIESPSITPTPTPTASPSISPTDSPTPTLSVTITETVTPTISGTATPTPTGPTPTITNTPTPTATNSPTPTTTNTPTPSVTGTITVTPTDSPTPTVTPTESPTSTPTATPSITETPTNTPTGTITITPTDSPTPTVTDTPSPTSTNTPTPTITPTMTNTPTPTLTSTVTPTVSGTVTLTPTATPTGSLTPTPTPIPTGGQVLGTFPLPGGKSAVCTLNFRRIGPPFSPFYLPYVRCMRV